jgi:hypothetical protein
MSEPFVKKTPIQTSASSLSKIGYLCSNKIGLCAQNIGPIQGSTVST